MAVMLMRPKSRKRTPGELTYSGVTFRCYQRVLGKSDIGPLTLDSPRSSDRFWMKL